MTEILSQLFAEAKTDEIGNLCYLLQGRVAPLFAAVEFGVADKMMVRAIAQGLNIKQEEVIRTFKQEGDLGSATEKLKTQNQVRLGQNSKLKTTAQNLKINEIFDVLYKVATANGEGSQEVKIQLLGNLLIRVDPLSARYIVRITLAKLRLGFSDMTILDSLSWMLKKSKELRPEIEKAYNVRPDLGFVSKTIKKEGIGGLVHASPKVGTPILMARAERMASGTDIIEKIGKCAIEPKYDGFRLQIHHRKVKSQKSKVKSGDLVKLFSRNLEDVTRMYPDIVKGVVVQINAHEAIFEGEAIGFDPKTGRYLPFQETVQRKRKYGIAEMAAKIPLKLIAFDLLFVDGENLINKPYSKRRKKLEKIVG
ncbi:ATP-dependent DNA ligase [Candidatus Gottesmanbacteria bacterium]|nr:ATP-dependent DNA ligase [Candidatus Gottesmanbacteria bacterium]